MLIVEVWMNLKLLATQGHSIRAIASMTGLSRNTVRRALRQKAPQAFDPPRRQSKLDQFKAYLEQRYFECRLSAVRLVEEIRAMGYAGSVDTVRRFLHSLRTPSPALDKLTVRFETPPGHQAQADWGYCGRFPHPAGKMVPLYLFVIVLAFSRYMYIEFTTSMKLPELIRCHLRAFEFFGGWPQTILYDNMKQVKLSRQEWNPLFIDFAAHYGIAAKTHQPRRPRTKGKVERMVDYVKGSFLNGRSFEGLADLNAQGWHWLTNVANVRTHATTGNRPIDLLQAENLTAHASIAPYQITQKAARKVDSSGFVRWCGSRYSVPPANTGKLVLIEQGEQQITIKCDDLIIAQHAAADKRGSCVAACEHIAELWKLSLARPAQPERHWEVTFQQTVESAPLACYEEVIQ